MSRRYIGKKHTYRMDDRNYGIFKSWCSRRGVDTSSAIRGAIGLLMEQGNLSELLEDEEMERFAVEIIRGNLEKNKGVSEND